MSWFYHKPSVKGSSWFDLLPQKGLSWRNLYQWCVFYVVSLNWSSLLCLMYTPRKGLLCRTLWTTVILSCKLSPLRREPIPVKSLLSWELTSMSCCGLTSLPGCCDVILHHFNFSKHSWSEPFPNCLSRLLLTPLQTLLLPFDTSCLLQILRYLKKIFLPGRKLASILHI